MFGKNAKVDLELNRDVEQLIKTGGKEKLLPIVPANRCCANGQWPIIASSPSVRSPIHRYDAHHHAGGTRHGPAATQLDWGSRSPWSKTTCATTRMIRAKSRNSPST